MTTNERNSVAKILTPVEFQSLENSLGSLIEEYRDKGSVKLDSLIPILGKPPIIPQSPDMDAMLEAWDEKAEYGRKVEIIEAFLKSSSK